MHPKIYAEFETICRTLNFKGRVLEIGASPQHQSLLGLPSLDFATKRIGIGLDGAVKNNRFEIIHRNAHDLSCFDNGSFDLILCNSMLEHDPQFWRTVAEAYRVAAKGAWFVYGVPGYAQGGAIPVPRLLRFLSKLPLIGHPWNNLRQTLQASSLSLAIHHYPADYYRFSEQAMAEILLSGLERIETRLVMSPPRVIGIGQKPI
jgi:SAM-dependent methyltransferase